MSAEFWAIISVGVVFGAFQWRIAQDMGSLRERMAKLEGAMDGFTKGFSIEN